MPAGGGRRVGGGAEGSVQPRRIKCPRPGCCCLVNVERDGEGRFADGTYRCDSGHEFVLSDGKVRQ